MKNIKYIGCWLAFIACFGSFSTGNAQTSNKQNTMKEYVLLIRLPENYAAADAAAVRPQWTALTDQWKADNIFVTSFVFPAEGYVVSSDKTAGKGSVVSDKVKMISSIVVRAASLEDALLLAKVCPVLDQGGTIEVREIQQRTPEITAPAEKTD